MGFVNAFVLCIEIVQSSFEKFYSLCQIICVNIIITSFLFNPEVHAAAFSQSCAMFLSWEAISG